MDRSLGIAWHPSQPYVALATSKASVDVIELESLCRVRQLSGHTNDAHLVAYDPTGRLLTSAATDGTVRTWRTDTWEPVTVNTVSADADIPVGGAAVQLSSGRIAWLDQYRGVICIAAPDPDALLHRAVAVKTIHYTSGRAVLVGSSGTGKTCIANALLDLPFVPAESTHGMTVSSLNAETVSREDGSRVTRETLLWDLAGQPEYQLIHQLFLDDAAVGIVVFDATDPDDPFHAVKHWGRALRRVAGTCRKLLVAGRIDRGDPTVTASEIGQYCREHGFERFVATSAATGAGIDELKLRIAHMMPWDTLPVTSSPELWLKTRDYVARTATKDPLITAAALHDAFAHRNPSLGISRAEFDTVLAHAQSHGFVWRLSFGGFLLLRPDLLNGYASAVIQAARRHRDGLGCVQERDILEGNIDFRGMERIQDPSSEQVLLHAVVELFLQREIAFREGEWLVFPSRLNRGHPAPSTQGTRAVYFRFEGLPEQVYATLVVRMAHSQVFVKHMLWKNGAEFAYGSGRCAFELRTDGDGESELSLYLGDNVPQTAKRLFAHFVQEHLERRALPGTFSREVVYRCDACGWEVQDRVLLKKKIAQGQATLRCLDCEGTVSLEDALRFDPYVEGELGHRLRRMEEGADQRREVEVNMTTSAAKGSVGEFDVFLAHNSKDKGLVVVLANELRKRGISPWLDQEQVPPGRWFQDVIQAAIPRVKSAAIVIGSSGLGRWEAVELRAFISECVERDLPVIPVLLPGVRELPSELRFLRELNYVRFEDSIHDEVALSRLHWGIAQEKP
ncbi:TIR domain-containing protein [Sorangium sp. So ce341]|uniref:TIR domain-containing protein n=1 Tax=Sorangium sp. So ce341 TaxID=3133302 RepID=UPI003F5F16AC